MGHVGCAGLQLAVSSGDLYTPPMDSTLHISPSIYFSKHTKKLGGAKLNAHKVIESSHQARRSLDTEIRTSGALVDSTELVTMLAGSRERVSLPARHSTVPAASRVTGHVSPPAGGGDLTLPGAGPPDSPAAARSHPPGEFYRPAGSHHRAAGSWERGNRALASPGTPAAAERTPWVLAAVSTALAERTLGGHRTAWDAAGLDNATRTVLLLLSMETRPPGEPPHPGLEVDAVPRRNWASVKPGFPALLELCALDPALHPHQGRAVLRLASCMRVERRIHVASPDLEN
ncbi:hypothetical protein QYF61_003502 [Mycteria americana]|uniref:Uncharacterized protein n=1 Tax=Mycteria americana TaxID=33587 RepID=A0AAN7NU44_MYCAM|nr:hypothetical protein QYF61_003502 [Mycteria americana]